MPTRSHGPLAGLVHDAHRLQPRTVGLRRRLHRHPELGLRLPLTQAQELPELAALRLRLPPGTSLTSVVGVIEGDYPGPTVLLRGDMDALPLTEQTGLPFA